MLDVAKTQMERSQMDLCGGEAYIIKSRIHLKLVGMNSPSFRVPLFPFTFGCLTIPYITRARIRLSVPACGRKYMNDAANPLQRENQRIRRCLIHNNLPWDLISSRAGAPPIRHMSGSARRVQLDVELIQMHQSPVTMSYSQVMSV